MTRIYIKNFIISILVVAVVAGVFAAVRAFKKPGHMDVIAAQSMDMSSLSVPTGGAPVELATVRRGSLAAVVTYTGTIAAYNEQEISNRITGQVIELPVYPGDYVRAGQVVVRLDSAEVGAQAAQARAQARQARHGADAARLTEQLHHKAAMRQSLSQVQAADYAVSNATAQAAAAQEAIVEASAALATAKANDQYWGAEIAREKRLADAGAVSLQEYQNELAQAQEADAAVLQAESKARQAVSAAKAAQDTVAQDKSALAAARATADMASADMAIGEQQANGAQEGADAAAESARQAEVVQGYTEIRSPADGVVVERPIAPGTLVQPGTVILRIAEIDRVRVQANVSVNDMAGIALGSPVRINVEGDGSTIPVAGAVTSIFPAADTKTRTEVVEAVVANPDHRMLPGAFVSVAISKRAEPDKLLVPAGSIATVGGVDSVWVAQAQASTAGASEYQCEKCGMRFSAADAARDGYRDPMDGGRLVPVGGSAKSKLTAHQVPVHAGWSDGVWTEVTNADLDPGDRVVTRGMSGLSEGVGLQVHGGSAPPI